MSEVKLESSWYNVLKEEFQKPYMLALKNFLLQQKQQGKIIYPKGSEIFQAFALTPLNQVRVVLLGQDPYHGPNQAHGLCFSVKPNIPLPPSLVNIYKELNSDLGVTPAKHGCLSTWAKQGILLLNSVLTVEQGLAGSHQGKGWEIFTNQVINILNNSEYPIIFLLWGSYAQQKGQFLDAKKHVILQAAHPSPLSAYRGFFGCKHFSKVNEYLSHWGEPVINWQLPEMAILPETTV